MTNQLRIVMLKSLSFALFTFCVCFRALFGRVSSRPFCSFYFIIEDHYSNLTQRFIGGTLPSAATSPQLQPLFDVSWTSTKCRPHTPNYFHFCTRYARDFTHTSTDKSFFLCGTGSICKHQYIREYWFAASTRRW